MKEKEELNLIPYELIIDELEERLSEKKQKELQLWRTASSANETIYQQFLNSSDKIELLLVYKKSDENKSWTAFSKLLDKQTENTTSSIIKPLKQTAVLKLRWVAAVAATLLLFSSLYLLLIYNKADTTVITLANNHQKVILPDRTELYLSDNTEIAYNKSNYIKSRIITLVKGEVFLNVIHNERTPFIVQSGELKIKDVGTAFNVKSDGRKTTVIVSTGKVALIYSKNGKNILLNPNDKGSFDTSTKKIEVTINLDTNYRSWYDKKFQFIQTPLNEVSEKIEKAYGCHIAFQDSLMKKRKLTATFQNQSIDEIMRIIAVSLELKVEKKDNIFLFKY